MPRFYIYSRHDGIPPSTSPDATKTPALILDGKTLGDALNSYLKSQLVGDHNNLKRVSLKGLDLSITLDMSKQDIYKISSCRLDSYNYINLTDCNLNGIRLIDTILENIDFTGSDLSNTKFDYSIITNVIFNNSQQYCTSFKNSTISNFLAQDVVGYKNDFTDSIWKTNKKYTGLNKFSFKSFDDVTEGSEWALSKWEGITTEDTGMATLKGSRHQTGWAFTRDRILKPGGKYTLYGLGSTVTAKGMGIDFAEPPDSVSKTFVHHLASNQHMDKAYNFIDTISAYKDQPYKLFGYLMDNGFNTHNTLKWAEAFVNYENLPQGYRFPISSVTHIVGSFLLILGAGFASEKLGKLAKFCDTKTGGHGQKMFKFFGETAQNIGNKSLNFKRYFEKMTNIIRNSKDMLLVNGVYNINRSVRRNLASLGIETYKMKIGDKEYLLTKPENRKELERFLLKSANDNIGNPFAVSYPGNTKALDPNIPMTLIKFPNKDTAFVYLKNEGQQRVFSGAVIFDKNHDIAYKVGDCPNTPQYGKLMQDFLSNAPDYNANAILDNINYDKNTHYAVRDATSIMILSKDTGEIDNPSDFAKVTIENNMVSYEHIQNGNHIDTVEQVMNTPKPSAPTLLNDDEISRLAM